jgi:F-type H+-transporting ATPase subunit delta
MAQLIASRYAKALFQLSLEDNSLESMIIDANAICNAFKENPEFTKIMEHPQISSKEKEQMFKSIFKENESSNIVGLINIMLQKNRESYVLEVIEDFLIKANEYKGVTTAYVSSAISLTEVQINSIKVNLSKNLNKQVEVELTVDKTLIGGLSIKVDGLIVDNTIKKQLKDAKKDLLGLQLA